MADVAGFGLWVGTPLGVVLMAFVWIAQLFATPQALVLTLIGTIGATVGIALWLWALHQMRNWTPGFGDASVGGGI